MKDYIWVVESKVEGVWLPWVCDFDARFDARECARRYRKAGGQARVRKYVRSGK